MRVNPINTCKNCKSPAHKHHTLAKTVALAGAVVAAAGSTVYLAKTGKLNPVNGGNKIIETAKKGLNAVAEKSETAFNFVKKGVSNVTKKIPQPVKTVFEKGKGLFTAAKNFVVDKFGKVADGVSNFVESKVNFSKFNPSLAKSQDLAEKTFNSFIK